MKTMSTHRKFAIVVSTLVGAVVIAGLWMAGSPGKERERRIDDTRVSDLQQISSAIDAYHAKNGSLPGSLEALVTVNKGEWYVRSVIDPETGASYEFLATEKKSYQLCATFTLPSETDPKMAMPMRAPYPVAVGYPDWSHPAGHHCYDLTVNTYPSAVCGLTNPCQAGQTCASLPDGKGTFCVPAGKECQAAGCPNDQCVLMESYPVQVRCAPAPVVSE